MDSLRTTVFEDQSILDDSSTCIVREHFKRRAVATPQQKQGTGPVLSLCYRYCMRVDAKALEVVIHNAPAPPQPDATSDSFFNLIWKDWEPSRPGLREKSEEPIEGYTQHNVGWMMVAYQDVMVDMYYYLCDWNDWYSENDYKTQADDK